MIIQAVVAVYITTLGQHLRWQEVRWSVIILLQKMVEVYLITIMWICMDTLRSRITRQWLAVVFGMVVVLQRMFIWCMMTVLSLEILQRRIMAVVYIPAMAILGWKEMLWFQVIRLHKVLVVECIIVVHTLRWKAAVSRGIRQGYILAEESVSTVPIRLN